MRRHCVLLCQMFLGFTVGNVYKGINWAYETDPQPKLHNRKIYWYATLPPSAIESRSASMSRLCSPPFPPTTDPWSPLMAGHAVRSWVAAAPSMP